MVCDRPRARLRLECRNDLTGHSRSKRFDTGVLLSRSHDARCIEELRPVLKPMR